MANLNLSEFTEKLFVTDADHTFIWDTANAISKRVSRNSWLNSGTLTSDAPVTISQTWGTTGTYTAFKVVANETATAATASNLLELWSGSTAALKLSIGKGGSIFSKVGVITPSGTANAAGLSLELFFTGCGLGIDNNGSTQFLVNGTAKTKCGLGIVVASDQAIAWSSTTHTGLGVASDTVLLRDGAANTLALRNGAAAQTFNVYGTYSTSPSLAYSRLAIACDTSGNATLTTQSTGVAGTISINGVPVGLGKGNVAGNIAIGTGTINATATGGDNIAIGTNALSNVTIGVSNIAIGLRSLFNQTIWGYNVAIGLEALYLSSTAAEANVGIGIGALYHNQTGSYTVAMGHSAGRATSVGNNTGAVSNSVYLGALTKALGAGQTNQIVIGYDATGIGSNSVVLGNDSITKTGLKGNVGIGTTNPTSNLTVAQPTAGVGTISVGAGLTTVTGVGTQFLNTFAVGQTITSAGQTLTISAIASDTSMTTSAAGAAITGQPYTLVGGTRMSVLGNGNVGIGTPSPSSKLQVSAGDVEVDTIAKGVILKSPDGTRYRVTVANGGTLSVAAV